MSLNEAFKDLLTEFTNFLNYLRTQNVSKEILIRVNNLESKTLSLKLRDENEDEIDGQSESKNQQENNRKNSDDRHGFLDKAIKVGKLYMKTWKSFGKKQEKTAILTKDSKLVLFKTDSYKISDTIDIQNAFIQRNQNKPRKFSVTLKDRETYLFEAIDQSDRDDWLFVLHKASCRLLDVEGDDESADIYNEVIEEQEYITEDDEMESEESFYAVPRPLSSSNQQDYATEMTDDNESFPPPPSPTCLDTKEDTIEDDDNEVPPPIIERNVRPPPPPVTLPPKKKHHQKLPLPLTSPPPLPPPLKLSPVPVKSLPLPPPTPKSPTNSLPQSPNKFTIRSELEEALSRRKMQSQLGENPVLKRNPNSENNLRRNVSSAAVPNNYSTLPTIRRPKPPVPSSKPKVSIRDIKQSNNNQLRTSMRARINSITDEQLLERLSTLRKSSKDSSAECSDDSSEDTK